MTLILASRSASRQAMLRDAGVAFRCEPAEIDERALEAELADDPPAGIALALARAKALAIVGADATVLGSDSLVVVEGRRFDKPGSREEAEAHLKFFSGRMMELHSAAALAQSGKIVWSCAEVAELSVRELSDAFIGAYLDAEWPAVSGCVGVFRMEACGVQLFDDVKGSHFTVLGMPLLPVLAALRNLGELPA
jgi:septum formation protein